MSESTVVTSTASTTSISLNTRIRDADGFVGTVVYVGSVASSKNPQEQYAGIVWDDSSRGKHDGSVVCRETNRIVRHFSCGTTQGSFLKLRKLDLGVALTATLLRQKYVKMNAPIIAPNNILPHSLTTSSGREKTVEFMGELKIRKQQQLENIDKVSLRREGISKASENENMAEFQHIKEIDLAGNLLSSWDQVFNIIGQFSALENFSVAHNYVRDINVNTTFGIEFNKVKILNLNNCFIRSFGTVQVVAETMPNLESLCIANSKLSDIGKFDCIKGFQRLRQLDCSDCDFHRWENEVSQFASLPHLESLSIDNNPIPSIPFNAGTSPLFPMLSSLRLSGTAISSWMQLEAINSFSSLKALRFKSIPLTESLGEAEARSSSIARFPKIEYLNASRVTNDERREAERRYVTLISHSLQKTKLNENQRIDFLEEHPRYVELTEKHNYLATKLKENMDGGKNLAASIYNITIKSMAASSCTMDPIVRRLPGTMSVERIKAMCSRTFDVDFDLIRLRFRTDKTDGLPVELNEDSKTLDYYGLCDGAEVLVDEVDLRARASVSKSNDEKLEERIFQLDRSIAILKNARMQR